MTLLKMSIYGAVIILVVLIIRAISLHKLPKQTFLILWAVALVRLLIPFEITSGLSLYSLLPELPEELSLTEKDEPYIPDPENPYEPFENYADYLKQQESNTEIRQNNPIIIDQNGDGAIYLPNENLEADAIPLPDVEADANYAEGTLPSKENPMISSDPDTNNTDRLHALWHKILPHLPLLWAAGAFLCAVFFLICNLKCLREFRTALPVTEDYATEWLNRHPLKRNIIIRQSDKISAPLTYGMFRPVILLPKKTDWTNLTQLDYILYHEFTHIRRFDLAAKLVMIAALCLHWFNPFVWVMYVFFNRDLELSCDDLVVKHFGETKSVYANALIDMEEKKNYSTPLCNHFSKNAIEERITAIMKSKKTTLGMMAIAILIVIAVVVTLTTGRADKNVISDITLTPTVLPTKAVTPRPTTEPTPPPGMDIYYPELDYTYYETIYPANFQHSGDTVSLQNGYNFEISSLVSAAGKNVLSNLTINLEEYAGGTAWWCMAVFYAPETDAVYLEFVPAADAEKAPAGILHVTIPVSNPAAYTVRPAGHFEEQKNSAFWFSEICKIRNRIYFNHANHYGSLWVYDITTGEMSDLSYVNEKMQELASELCADFGWEQEPTIWHFVNYESIDGTVTYQAHICKGTDTETFYTLYLHYEGENLVDYDTIYHSEIGQPLSQEELNSQVQELFFRYRDMQDEFFNTNLKCADVLSVEDWVSINGQDGFLKVTDERFPTLQSVIDYMETICTPDFAEQLRNQYWRMNTLRPTLAELYGELYSQCYDGIKYSESYRFSPVSIDGPNTYTLSYEVYIDIPSNKTESGTVTFLITPNGLRISDIDDHHTIATEDVYEQLPASGSIPTTDGPDWYNAVSELMHGDTPKNTTEAEQSFHADYGDLKCIQPSNENGHLFTISNLVLWEEKNVVLKDVSLDLSPYTTSFIWRENGIYYDDPSGEVYVIFSPSLDEAKGGTGMVDYQVLLATIPQVGSENYTIRCYGNPENPLKLGGSYTYGTTKIDNLIYLGESCHGDMFYTIDINTKELQSLSYVNDALHAQANSYLEQCGLGTEFAFDNRVVCKTRNYMVFSSDISHSDSYNSPTYFTIYHAYKANALVGTVIFRHQIAFYDAENLSHVWANYITMDDVVRMAKEEFSKFCNTQNYTQPCEITSIHMTTFKTIEVKFLISESGNSNVYIEGTVEFTYDFDAEVWSVSHFEEIPATG